MHIPDSMLQGTVCPVTAVVSALGLGIAVCAAVRSKNRPTSARFAAITALIFAAQMMNFAIHDGTSGHLIGGVLSAVLLGVPFGVLSLALVITIQSLVFSDGGIFVLGANVLNMALIGSGAGGILYLFFSGGAKSKNLKNLVFLGLAAWVSVITASVAVSLELAVCGAASFARILPSMVGTHALIGIGEALITIAVYVTLVSGSESVSDKWSISAPVTASIIIGLILSPFACGFPDGLEWVAERYHLFHDAAPAFVGFFPDYTIPVVDNGILSTGIAGLAGTLLTFLMAWFLCRQLNSGHAMN